MSPLLLIVVRIWIEMAGTVASDQAAILVDLGRRTLIVVAIKNAQVRFTIGGVNAVFVFSRHLFHSSASTLRLAEGDWYVYFHVPVHLYYRDVRWLLGP